MRLIDANKLKELRDKYIRGEIEFDDEYDLIDRCPTVDAVLTAHGRWIEGKDYLKCSVCRGLTKKDFRDGCWNYCPNCGTKMDGETEDK